MGSTMPIRPQPDPRFVHIHYLRPPNREQIFVQELLHEDAKVSITLARRVELPSPVKVDGEVVLESGSDALWFTFPGAWHDIGRFHRTDGTFTGIYANILTPCTFEAGGVWRTTDLFLDLWIPAGGKGPVSKKGTANPETVSTSGDEILLLDEEELQEAESQGWVTGELAARARSEAHRLMEAYRQGEWPPRIVYDWIREKGQDPDAL